MLFNYILITSFPFESKSDKAALLCVVCRLCFSFMFKNQFFCINLISPIKPIYYT